MTEPETPTVKVFGPHFWVPVIIVFVFSLATFGGALWLTNHRADLRADDLQALAETEAEDAKQAFIYTCQMANSLRSESTDRGRAGAALFEYLRAFVPITDTPTLLAIDDAIRSLTRTGPLLSCVWPPVRPDIQRGPPLDAPPLTIPTPTTITVPGQQPGVTAQR